MSSDAKSLGAAGPLVLVEPYAYRVDGHHGNALLALAGARRGTVVVAPNGIADRTGAGLRDAGALVITGAYGFGARLMLRGARVMARLSTCGRRAFRSARWPQSVRRCPHQFTLVERCLVEAAALRTARRRCPAAGGAVVLSASEALHGAAAVLGGTGHVRFVHEVVTTEDAPVHLLGRAAAHGERRVTVLCPTAAVRETVAARFPGLTCRTRAFAVDEGRALSDGERARAREAFGIPASDAAVCLVGGWWPHKDIDVINRALARLSEQLHLFVVGHPLDEATLRRWRRLPHVRLHARTGPASPELLRTVYAAADATLVARHRGVGKESGLVMDAAHYGVPLIVSDHDPALTAQLASQSWVRLFPAGDAEALAKAISGVQREHVELPGPEAARALGMRAPAEQAAFLLCAAHACCASRKGA